MELSNPVNLSRNHGAVHTPDCAKQEANNGDTNGDTNDNDNNNNTNNNTYNNDAADDDVENLPAMYAAELQPFAPCPVSAPEDCAPKDCAPKDCAKRLHAIREQLRNETVKLELLSQLKVSQNTAHGGVQAMLPQSRLSVVAYDESAHIAMSNSFTPLSGPWAHLPHHSIALPKPPVALWHFGTQPTTQFVSAHDTSARIPFHDSTNLQILPAQPGPMGARSQRDNPQVVVPYSSGGMQMPPGRSGASLGTGAHSNAALPPMSPVLQQNFQQNFQQNLQRNEQHIKLMLQQRDAIVKTEMRKKLEKMLLEINPPKSPPQSVLFVPSVKDTYFAKLLGLEAVVDYLMGIEHKKSSASRAIVCAQCKTDFTPLWKRGRYENGVTALICERCASNNLKRSLKIEHTKLLKQILVQTIKEETENARIHIASPATAGLGQFGLPGPSGLGGRPAGLPTFQSFQQQKPSISATRNMGGGPLFNAQQQAGPQRIQQAPYHATPQPQPPQPQPPQQVTPNRESKIKFLAAAQRIAVDSWPHLLNSPLLGILAKLRAATVSAVASNCCSATPEMIAAMQTFHQYMNKTFGPGVNMNPNLVQSYQMALIYAAQMAQVAHAAHTVQMSRPQTVPVAHSSPAGKTVLPHHMFTWTPDNQAATTQAEADVPSVAPVPTRAATAVDSTISSKPWLPPTSLPQQSFNSPPPPPPAPAPGPTAAVAATQQWQQVAPESSALPEDNAME